MASSLTEHRECEDVAVTSRIFPFHGRKRSYSPVLTGTFPLSSATSPLGPTWGDLPAPALCWKQTAFGTTHPGCSRPGACGFLFLSEGERRGFLHPYLCSFILSICSGRVKTQACLLSLVSKSCALEEGWRYLPWRTLQGRPGSQAWNF